MGILLLLVHQHPAAAQTDNTDSLIRDLDSVFWQAYNRCDVGAMMQYVADDVEFYHDKGGVTLGKAAFTANTQNNLCGKATFRLRREAVPATVQVFPMHQNGKVYGAIISGEHLFYINDSGKPEYLDGHARFSQLWLLRNEAWKMARILSYDHGAAAEKIKRKELKLPATALRQFEGTYQSKEKGALQIRQSEGHLLLQAGTATFALTASDEDHFFVKDKDLSFRFSRDAKNRVRTMQIVEKGTVVEEATKQ